MTPEAVRRAEMLLGVEAGSWTRVAGRGYSIAEHWIMRWDGGAAFLKLAVTDDLARRLRDEHRLYAALDAAFLPRLLGWDDDGRRPLLVLEDLTPGASWPPPWTGDEIDAVRATLAEVAATPPPAALPRLANDELPGWERVAANVDAFLGLGACSRPWLERALPALADAASATDLGGDELLHLDVRSDNLCVRDGRAILVDWNFVCVGNAAFDTAFWLPSLALEGGPPPWELSTPPVDALAAGFFAALAWLPPPQGAPMVRPFQLAQLEVALPWAARVLGLPPPESTEQLGRHRRASRGARRA